MGEQKIKNPHVPFLRETEGSETAILMIHGIFGSPSQFERLAQKLFEQGFTVMGVLLPGHGGSAKDFSKAASTAWLQEVSRAASFLRERYKYVILLGHSLGGLLAINESIRNGVDGLVLLSVPIRIRIRFNAVWASLRVLWGKPARDDDFLKAYRLAYSVGRGSVFRYATWVIRLADLLGLTRKTRHILNQLRVPVLIVQSKKDEVVSYKSILEFQKNLRPDSFEVVTLEKSGHGYLYQDEADVLSERVCSFTKGLHADQKAAT